MPGSARKPVALIRHGEATVADTDFQRVLTEAGREQAVICGEWLEPLGLLRAVYSGSRRAGETVDLAVPGIDAATEPALTGLKVGTSETPLRGLEALAGPFADPEARLPDGESLVELRDRVSAALATIAAEGEATAIVAHRFVNTVLVGDLLRVPLQASEALVQDPGAVNLIDPGATPEVVVVNAAPADPLHTGPRGGLLPDSDERIERRRYLVATGSPTDADRQGEVAAAVTALRNRLDARWDVLAPAEVKAMCCELAGLGEAADWLPAPPGTVAVLDECHGRWWVRTLGWAPEMPARTAAGEV